MNGMDKPTSPIRALLTAGSMDIHLSQHSRTHYYYSCVVGPTVGILLFLHIFFLVKMSIIVGASGRLKKRVPNFAQTANTEKIGARLDLLFYCLDVSGQLATATKRYK